MSLNFAKRMKVASDVDWLKKSPDERSLALATECKDKSLTDQSQAAEADINVLVKRFGVTGTMPQRANAVPMDEDSPVDFNLQRELNSVNDARFAFDQLPLHVRKRFGYDPLEFSTAILDPEKGPILAHELGLTVVREPDKIPRVEIANIGDLMKKESENVSDGKGA